MTQKDETIDTSVAAQTDLGPTTLVAIEQYFPAIERIIHDDLAQKIFLRVWKSSSRYEPKAKFTTWLWTISRNSALDYLRKKKDYHLEDMKNHEDESSPVDKIASQDEDQEKQLVNKARQIEIEKCMKNIPPFQREALSLRIMSELSYDEISNMINKTTSSVKSLINRAKGSLLICLKRGGTLEK